MWIKHANGLLNLHQLATIELKYVSGPEDLGEYRVLGHMASGERKELYQGNKEQCEKEIERLYKEATNARV